MILFKQAKSLSNHLSVLQQSKKNIGFVPTMGALHQGHLSLLQQAKTEAGVTVCSIFINPTQFNNADDFKKYPVTIEQDIALLANHGCDVLFLPSTEEIYAPGYQPRKYDLGNLETILEGHYRPGHFQGVCQVVDRLLEIVHPDRLYLGQKDFQQCRVINRLLTQIGKEHIQLVTAETIREEDGLAMSSRNLRLTKKQRAKAPCIYKALLKAKQDLGNQSIDQIKADAVNFLTENGFKVDYFEIADTATLLPSNNIQRPGIALVAAYLDDIRLIDNLLLN